MLWWRKNRREVEQVRLADAVMAVRLWRPVRRLKGADTHGNLIMDGAQYSFTLKGLRYDG